MQTTSLKLPDEIKQRATVVAQQQGVSAHAFMVSAITQATAAAEVRAGFIADALAAKDSMMISGEGYEANDVHQHLRARIAGNQNTRPELVTWRG